MDFHAEPIVPADPTFPHRLATRSLGSRERRSVMFWASGALVTGGAVALGWLRSRRSAALAGGIGALVVAAARWQLDRMFAHEPRYTVERRIGELEIRRYAPRVEARTVIADSDFDRAREVGFRRLAAYIFGANRGREELEMTTPVRLSGGETLAMTTPVTLRDRGGGAYVMSFVMPPGRTLADLPTPQDDRIELLEVPARRVAVLRFRGRYDERTVGPHRAKLADLVAREDLPATSTPTFAGFDPPWVLGPLRRNEVWVELA